MPEDEKMKQFEMFEKFSARTFHKVRKQLLEHKEATKKETRNYIIKG